MNAIDELMARHPELKPCEAGIRRAAAALSGSFAKGGKVLVCGNGGSAADAEHICGELLKKFRRRGDIDAAVAARLPRELAERLEGAFPAIPLVSMGGFLSAFANDVAWETAFAQQVYALGAAGDVLLVLSTSGNSVNCVNAALVARAKGLVTVVLTGAGGGRLGEIADVTIAVPESETYRVQELHLPVYHALCAAVEEGAT